MITNLSHIDFPKSPVARTGRLTRSTVGELAARLAEGVSDKAALILYGPLMEDL